MMMVPKNRFSREYECQFVDDDPHLDFHRITDNELENLARQHKFVTMRAAVVYHTGYDRWLVARANAGSMRTEYFWVSERDAFKIYAYAPDLEPLHPLFYLNTIVRNFEAQQNNAFDTEYQDLILFEVKLDRYNFYTDTENPAVLLSACDIDVSAPHFQGCLVEDPEREMREDKERRMDENIVRV